MQVCARLHERDNNQTAFVGLFLNFESCIVFLFIREYLLFINYDKNICIFYFDTKVFEIKYIVLKLV